MFFYRIFLWTLITVFRFSTCFTYREPRYIMYVCMYMSFVPEINLFVFILVCYMHHCYQMSHYKVLYSLWMEYAPNWINRCHIATIEFEDTHAWWTVLRQSKCLRPSERLPTGHMHARTHACTHACKHTRAESIIVSIPWNLDLPEPHGVTVVAVQ